MLVLFNCDQPCLLQIVAKFATEKKNANLIFFIHIMYVYSAYISSSKIQWVQFKKRKKSMQNIKGTTGI